MSSSSRYRKTSSQEPSLLGSFVLWVGIVAVFTLFMTIVWGLLHLIAPGTKYPYTFDRAEMVHWFPEGLNFFGATPWLWFYFAGLAILLGVCLGTDGTDKAVGIGFITGLIGFVLCISFAIPGLVSRDKVVAQFYQRNTTFYVPDPANVPSAISRMAQGGKANTDGCAVKPIHDVPGCIQKGVLPDQVGLWEGRSSSYDGAKTVLASSVAVQQGADLLEGSITYVGGQTASAGHWTAVIDGSGAYNSAKGVASWDGKTQQVTKCLFGDKHSGTQDYRFNRAFEGAKKNSLSHLILSKFPNKIYDVDDVWGYCAGNKPYFVVPMTKYVPFHHQMFQVPAGFLIIGGSETGDPMIELVTDAAKGQYDALGGPLIPSSVVAKQRETLDWAAGRKFKNSASGNNGGFGFDTASAETQAGNDSEYRLYNTVEKRWFYVTPLVPNNAKSQTYIAYALTPTDEVHAGQLPELRVFVPDSESDTANADRIHSEALTYIGNAFPGFKANGGDLHEIVPLGGSMWRLYGEVKGYTTHYIDVDADFRIAPKVTELAGNPALPPSTSLGSPTPTSGPSSGSQKVCEKAVSAMTTKEKADCIKALTDSLATR